MLFYLFWGLIGLAVLMLAAMAVAHQVARYNFELGARAERDGIPLQVGWPNAMQDGWFYSWRARHGINDLADELELYL
jgi:hypothetical protein